ncbi:zinc-ribbon domain-containing protein [Oribacterium sp. NK2B42]|uniref:zinc-ribbon domain-containing protein n=1 Tax=Oribacterium sp. NK2B42 TaxID=689781 RepID=UPI0003F57D7D|nr:zinc-ribbon domain-containing protein [Oribacterium sp. NK2B42]
MKETLAEKCPQLATQWSNMNLPLRPSDVTIGSQKRVWWKGTCGHEWQAIVKNRVNGADCPYCSGNQLLKGFNDLATMKPELISEWSDQNLPLLPDMVLSCSNKSVWWKCIHGHEWVAKVADRYYGSQCPYCEGHKVYKGFNDLASNFPELAREWSEKNSPKRADEVFPKSRENVWWKCHVCGYEWRAVIDSRVKGSSCPVCSDRVVEKGVNDLATTDPVLVREWDHDRNKMISPESVHRNSMRIVWWKCHHGHRWRAKIADRAIDNEPCHICRKAFEKEFPDMLLRYYLSQEGYTIIIDEEELIGVPLSNYIKSINAVIEFSKPFYNTKDGYRWEYAKTQLCRNARIKMIRILKQKDKEFEDCVCITRLDNSDEALAEAIRLALHILGIEIEPDVTTDREILFGKYMEK